MFSFLRLFLIGLMLCAPAGLAHAQERAEHLKNDTEVVEPEPDWDNPRKIVLQVTAKDDFHVNNVYYNAINLQKFYGTDNVKVAIVFFGPGVRPMLKESAIAPERVKSLQDYEVEFIVCNNTMTTIGKTQDDLLPGVRLVTSGIAEIIEKKIAGWHYIIP